MEEVTPSTYPNSVAVSVAGIPSKTFNSVAEEVILKSPRFSILDAKFVVRF